jgi:hypothetical protein
LDLLRNHLAGSIPNSLGSLTSLTYVGDYRVDWLHCLHTCAADASAMGQCSDAPLIPLSSLR